MARFLIQACNTIIGRCRCGDMNPPLLSRLASIVNVCSIYISTNVLRCLLFTKVALVTSWRKSSSCRRRSRAPANRLLSRPFLAACCIAAPGETEVIPSSGRSGSGMRSPCSNATDVQWRIARAKQVEVAKICSPL